MHGYPPWSAYLCAFAALPLTDHRPRAHVPATRKAALPSPRSPSHIRPMAKSPDSKKGKDPARPTRAKAAREPLAPIAPALEKLLNPGIAKGTAGVGSQTGPS